MATSKTAKTLDELRAEYAKLQQQIKEKEAEEAAAKKAELERKQAELEAQKAVRLAEIDAAEQRLLELYKAYIKDYGRLEINRTASADPSFGWLFKRHWFF